VKKACWKAAGVTQLQNHMTVWVLHWYSRSYIYAYSCGSSWTGSITPINRYLTFCLHCTYINNGVFYKFLSLRVTVYSVYGKQYCRHTNEGLIQSYSVQRSCFIGYHCKLAHIKYNLIFNIMYICRRWNFFLKYFLSTHYWNKCECIYSYMLSKFC
jgi:hypothetical protein